MATKPKGINRLSFGIGLLCATITLIFLFTRYSIDTLKEDWYVSICYVVVAYLIGKFIIEFIYWVYQGYKEG